jgi:hypothetical protein
MGTADLTRLAAAARSQSRRSLLIRSVAVEDGQSVRHRGTDVRVAEQFLHRADVIRLSCGFCGDRGINPQILKSSNPEILKF